MARRPDIAIALALLILAVPVVQAASSTLTWTLFPSPNVEGDDLHRLLDVACAAPSDCWAVGYSSTCVQASLGEYAPPNPTPVPVPTGAGLCNIHHTLALHWDGDAWAVALTPSPNFKANQLYDVTCIATDDCWAVGFRSDAPIGPQPLILHWDGVSWSWEVVDLPEGSLYGVDCAAADDCWAVGTGPDYTHTNGMVTLHWDGDTWSADWSLAGLVQGRIDQAVGFVVPDPPHFYNVLHDVTCVASDACMAVGMVAGFQESGGLARDALAARWDGNEWNVLETPQPNPDERKNTLEGVACVGAGCWAVGTSSQNLGTFLRWDGAAWTVHGTIAADELLGVTCVAVDDCWAVGHKTNHKTLIVHWNGVGWAAALSPNTGTLTTHNWLEGVACADATECWAVGRGGLDTLALGTVVPDA